MNLEKEKLNLINLFFYLCKCITFYLFIVINKLYAVCLFDGLLFKKTNFKIYKVRNKFIYIFNSILFPLILNYKSIHFGFIISMPHLHSILLLLLIPNCVQYNGIFVRLNHVLYLTAIQHRINYLNLK